MDTKFIRLEDKESLDKLIEALRLEELEADLRGSATTKSTYQDIDLNVWDTRKAYRGRREIIDGLLKTINAEEINFSPPACNTTWITGKWRFKINKTEFDLIYTPWGPSLQGYAKSEEKTPSN